MSKELRTELRENLQKKRPNLSVSSQNTYISLMSSLSKKLNVETYENLVSTNVKVVLNQQWRWGGFASTGLKTQTPHHCSFYL
jgi:hypothetical protein